MSIRQRLLLPVVLLCYVTTSTAQPNPELTGSWFGTASYSGESTELAVHFTEKDGQITASFDVPKTNIYGASLGEVVPTDSTYRAGPLSFQLRNHRLEGQLAWMPHVISLHLEKTDVSLSPPTPSPPRRTVDPVWTFTTEGPIWSSPSTRGEWVYIGSNDGAVYALHTASGQQRWQFQTNGPVLARPTAVNDAVYASSDDGVLYKLDALTGEQKWAFVLDDEAGARILPGEEGSTYDYLASAAIVADETVFVGSTNGSLYAIDATTGHEKWHIQTDGPVRSTPAVAEGRVFFGSYDHYVYAVEVDTGTLQWKHDTGQPVVSSPSYADGTIFIGSRSADLLAFEATTGAVQWSYFYWLSWIESSGTVYDDVLYIGSSDYQHLLAMDTQRGQPIWTFDTGGAPWSSPAVTEETVFVGAVGTEGYMVDHRGGFFAIDRTTGNEKWGVLFPPRPETSVYGVVSSPALTDRLVIFGGLDGIVYAMPAH